MSDKATDGDTSQADRSEVEIYNNVVASAELGDIRLLDVRYSVRPEYFSALDKERTGEGSLRRGFEGHLVDVRYDEDRKVLGGQFDWTTKVTHSRKRLLFCEAKYFVVYGNVPSIDMSIAEKYLLRVGRFATYPYFRSLISQLSWESQADLPILPILK